MAEEKTEYMQLAGMRGTRLSQILLGQKLIILVNSIKYLGVILDISHTFKAHVGYACSKAIGIINALHPIMKKTCKYESKTPHYKHPVSGTSVRSTDLCNCTKT